MTQAKPRYPAKVFRLLKNYPVRHCENPACRRQLTPNVYVKEGKYPALESVKSFVARTSCYRTCAGAVRRLKALAKRRTGPLDPATRTALKQAFAEHPDLLEVWS